MWDLCFRVRSPHAPETPGRALNQSVMSDEFGMGGVLDDELLPGM